MLTTSLYAQEILVESLKEIPLYELSGTEIQKDANGITCALLNVYFNEENVQFEGSYVVGSTTVGHSYQVYLAEGASKMVIKHDDYLPMSIVFADFGVKKMESNKAYEIKIIGDKTSTLAKEFASEGVEEKANSGDAEAQCRLGKMYYMGLNTEQDYEKAISWFTKSEKQGNIDAAYSLGLCYYNGQGVEQHYDIAIEYFKKAAENGHAMAQFKYACCLHNGFGAKGKDIDEAIIWYEKAASQGVLGAKNNVAVIYLFNDPTGYLDGKSDVNRVGFPQYYEKAIKYLFECEEANHPEAYTNLSNFYAFGVGVEKDVEKAVEYSQKAVENGCYMGYISLGNCYSDGIGVKKDDKKAFEYYKLAAQKGITEGYHNLAVCYDYGRGTKQNKTESVKYYQKAAEQNYALAEVNLAKMYHDGIGVEKDLKKAHDLFQNGAKHGDPLGYVNLGMMYQTGEYVGKDMNMAIEYYTKAADLGCYPGLLNLALIYQTGNGVPVDGLKAVEYYERGSKFDKSGAAENNIGIIYYLGCGTVQKNLKKAYEAFEKSAKKNCAQGQYHLGILYINGEYVEKNGKIGIDYVKKAAEQDYQPAVDYMKKIKQIKREMLLNSIMSDSRTTPATPTHIPTPNLKYLNKSGKSGIQIVNTSKKH